MSKFSTKLISAIIAASMIASPALAGRFGGAGSDSSW